MILASCRNGHHGVCNAYNGDLGHCTCVCHENPAHLASTCAALTRANADIEQEQADAARAQLVRASWLVALAADETERR